MVKSYNMFSLILIFHQSNWTPLIWAARRGHNAVVRLLLAAGVDVDAKNNVSKRILVCTCVFVFSSAIIPNDK